MCASVGTLGCHDGCTYLWLGVQDCVQSNEFNFLAIYKHFEASSCFALFILFSLH